MRHFLKKVYMYIIYLCSFNYVYDISFRMYHYNISHLYNNLKFMLRNKKISRTPSCQAEVLIISLHWLDVRTSVTLSFSQQTFGTHLVHLVNCTEQTGCKRVHHGMMGVSSLTQLLFLLDVCWEDVQPRQPIPFWVQLQHRCCVSRNVFRKKMGH